MFDDAIILSLARESGYFFVDIDNFANCEPACQQLVSQEGSVYCLASKPLVL